MDDKAAGEDFLRKNYEYFQHWHHWHDKAVTLRASALVLYRSALPQLRQYDLASRAATKELERNQTALVRFPHPDVLPAFSLFGYALENIFKGLLVSKEPTLVKADKLSDKLKEHNLLSLAAAAGITLSDREKRILGWVTEVTIWKARYSVPVNTKVMENFFDRLDNTSLADARSCKEAVETVFMRARKALPRRVRRSKFDVLVRLVD